MQGVDHYEDFTAICDHMPGKSPTLCVSGTVVFRTSGWSCTLQPTEGNTGINPRMLSLDLTITPPRDGETTTDVLTPVAVEWCEQEPAFEYEQVQFRVVGTDDEPPRSIDVVHPTRAEASAS